MMAVVTKNDGKVSSPMVQKPARKTEGVKTKNQTTRCMRMVH